MSIGSGPSTPVEVPQGEYDLPLKELLRVIRRRFWIIALVVFVVVGSAIYLSYQQTPMYEARSKILIGLVVGQEYSSGNAPGAFASDVEGLQKFSKTAAGLGNSRPTADGVARRLDSSLDPAHLQANMSVEQIEDTQTIEISYRDPSPEKATEVVNAITDVLSEQIPEMVPGSNAVTATVWEEAIIPQDPISPNKQRNTILALALGGMLGIGLAFLLERLDDRWRSPEEIEQVSGFPTFSVIPNFRTRKAPTSKKIKGKE